jgi:hypothetical protein
MRSIFIHLRDVSEDEVAAFLTRSYPLQPGPPWILDKSRDPVLYIDFYRDLDHEFEIEDWLAVCESLGGSPTVSLVADVSGRYPGDEEVRSFVSLLLGAFEGVAQDDYSPHCWTREQVMTGHAVQGHPFFDYNGWYHEARGAESPSDG